MLLIKIRFIFAPYKDLEANPYSIGSRWSFEKTDLEQTIYRTKNICENNQEIINSIENDFLKMRISPVRT